MANPCIKFDIGQFRHRVTFQQESQTSDGQGGYTKTWTNIATVWAKVEPIKQREREEAMSIGTDRTHKITTRYQSSINDVSYRISWGTRIFNITSVLNINERNVILEFQAVEFART